MIITKSVEVTEIKQVPVGKLCNKCGNVFELYDDRIQSSNTPLGEYGNCKSEICDNCWIEFIKSFSIVPTGFMSDPNFTSSFDLDHNLHQQLFNEWKISGEWNCDENPWRDYYCGEAEELIDETNEENNGATIYPFVNFKPEVTD